MAADRSVDDLAFGDYREASRCRSGGRSPSFVGPIVANLVRESGVRNHVGCEVLARRAAYVWDVSHVLPLPRRLDCQHSKFLGTRPAWPPERLLTDVRSVLREVMSVWNNIMVEVDSIDEADSSQQSREAYRYLWEIWSD